MVAKFFRKTLFLCLFVVFSIIFISLLPGESLLNAFTDKQQLLRTTRTPRMIFVGGSGLLYGLDSPCVEEVFGMPVINTGLHGGLGLRFMLSHVRPYIQPDDVLIVIPEFGVLARGYDFNAPTTAALAFTDPRDKINQLSPEDYLEALRGFPSVAYTKLIVRPIARLRTSQDPFAYSIPFYWRKSFNNNGDTITHLNSSKTLSPEQLKSYLPIGSNIDDSVAMLNEFAEYATRHGAKVFLAFPPTIDTRYRQYNSAVTKIYYQLKQELNMTVIASPGNYIYPIDFFYDSPEHLTARGRKARTERLIADMKQMMPGIAPVSTVTNTCAGNS